MNLDDDRVMYCSCQRFETTELFWLHQDSVAFAVSNEMGMDWEGFTKHDVAVRWWTSFMYFAYKKSPPHSILRMCHSLATNDVKVPVLSLRTGIPISITVLCLEGPLGKMHWTV